LPAGKGEAQRFRGALQVWVPRGGPLVRSGAMDDPPHTLEKGVSFIDEITGEVSRPGTAQVAASRPGTARPSASRGSSRRESFEDDTTNVHLPVTPRVLQTEHGEALRLTTPGTPLAGSPLGATRRSGLLEGSEEGVGFAGDDVPETPRTGFHGAQCAPFPAFTPRLPARPPLSPSTRSVTPVD
jgi:hypothetical protein